MKIVLGVDDSKFSAEAVRSVMEQFPSDGTEVYVVHAIEPISAYFSAEYFPHFVLQVEAVEQDRLKQADTLVEAISEKLRKSGFRTSKKIVRGDPRSVLLDCAEKCKADLIVVGSHGLKGLNRMLMGSISEAVIRHAPCSVQVVRLR
jgi:nucleotide-binding universal stress UspA family protein